jgi:adenosylcobinamide-phosphate synthase
MAGGVMSGAAGRAAVAADLLAGEPPARVHPTVWMGRAVTAARGGGAVRRPVPALLQGVAIVAGGSLLAWLGGRAAERVCARLPGGPRVAALGLSLKPALSLRALLDAGGEVERALSRGDLVAARRLLGWHLVSRDAGALSAEEVAGAAIESLAENLGDGLVGPLVAFRLGGLGGAYLYRFVNTCDAMLGYRSRELEWLGKPAARTDDVLNLLPARIAAALLVAAAAACGEDASGALRVGLRDARRTPSPNAGWPMAVMAGALGVRLTKGGTYVLNRGGRAPGAAELRRARRLVAVAGVLSAALIPGP